MPTIQAVTRLYPPAVPSMQIAGIGYDADARRLIVQFYAGGLCGLDGVPVSVAREFMASDRPSEYLRGLRDRFHRAPIDETYTVGLLPECQQCGRVIDIGERVMDGWCQRCHQRYEDGEIERL